jgi:hypothetical protein
MGQRQPTHSFLARFLLLPSSVAINNCILLTYGRRSNKSISHYNIYDDDGEARFALSISTNLYLQAEKVSQQITVRYSRYVCVCFPGLCYR